MFIEIPATKISLAMRRPVLGVGINDAKYLISHAVSGKEVRCPFYTKWHNMLKRCYSLDYRARFPSYIGCEVCDEWLVFSNFKAWMIKQDWQGKELDKDIKSPGNKIYSPEFCIFVSQAINSLLLDCALARGSYPVGVCYDKRSKKFASRCRSNRKKVLIGMFDTPAAASEAYNIFKSRLVLSLANKQDEPLRGYLVRISREINRKII